LLKETPPVFAISTFFSNDNKELLLNWIWSFSFGRYSTG